MRVANRKKKTSSYVRTSGVVMSRVESALPLKGGEEHDSTTSATTNPRRPSAGHGGSSSGVTTQSSIHRILLVSKHQKATSIAKPPEEQWHVSSSGTTACRISSFLRRNKRCLQVGVLLKPRAILVVTEVLTHLLENRGIVLLLVLLISGSCFLFASWLPTRANRSTAHSCLIMVSIMILVV